MILRLADDVEEGPTVRPSTLIAIEELDADRVRAAEAEADAEARAAEAELSGAACAARVAGSPKPSKLDVDASLRAPGLKTRARAATRRPPGKAADGCLRVGSK